jgi:LPXTG-site transpeptidase (sortase) family protein
MGRVRVISTAVTIVSAALLGFVFYLAIASRLHHDGAQYQAYANFRNDLALATAPTGPLHPGRTDLLQPGTPVALLDIPEIGVHEVVFEGTDGGVLRDGPGHQRSTPLPGQEGISIIMGRSTLYGGPFGRIGTLQPGDQFTVTTGQGVNEFKVLGNRRAGDLQRPLATGAGRVTLVTADGSPLVPNDVLRVDADLISDVQETPKMSVTAADMEDAEEALASDHGAVLPLVLFGEGLVATTWFTIQARRRWGRRPAWVVGVPVLGYFGLAVADQVARLLPNLM